MSRSPIANTAGIAMKITRPAYGLLSIPASMAITSVTNTTADTVVTTAPAAASGWRASVLILIANARYFFRLCM